MHTPKISLKSHVLPGTSSPQTATLLWTPINGDSGMKSKEIPPKEGTNV